MKITRTVRIDTVNCGQTILDWEAHQNKQHSPFDKSFGVTFYSDVFKIWTEVMYNVSQNVLTAKCPSSEDICVPEARVISVESKGYACILINVLYAHSIN